MTEKFDLTVSSEEFLAAGQLVDGPKSPLSPFQSGAENQPPPAAITSNGKFQSHLKPALQTLARAKGFGAAAYFSGDDLLDVSIYSSDSGTPDVALFLAEDGVRIESPADAGTVLDWLGQRIGTSLLRQSDVDLELSYEEALTLFATVDAARRRKLKELSGAADNEGEELKKEDLVSALTFDEEGFQWLAPHFANSHNLPGISESQAEQLLMKLTQKGFMVINADRITLSETLSNLANDLLVLSGHLLLTKAEADQDQRISMTEIRAVQGLKNALLLWTDDGKQVQLMGASPAQVMRIAIDILSSPDTPRRESMSEPAPAAANITEFAPAAADITEPARAAADITELAPAAANIIDQETHPQARKKGKRKKRRWWRILLILFGLFLFLAFILFFLLWLFA